MATRAVTTKYRDICIDAVPQDGGGGLLLEQEMGAGRHKMLVGGLQLRPRTRHALTFTPGGAGLPALPPGGGEAGLALDSWILLSAKQTCKS